jgi:hypothetical protein
MEGDGIDMSSVRIEYLDEIDSARVDNKAWLVRLDGAFDFRRKSNAVCYCMSVRSAGLAVAISLMVLGCATNQYASRAAVAIERVFQDQDDSRLWRGQKERQQRIAREAGRIGYIGNEGPALGSTISSSCQ